MAEMLILIKAHLKKLELAPSVKPDIEETEEELEQIEDLSILE
jgi:hypothetical protein